MRFMIGFLFIGFLAAINGSNAYALTTPPPPSFDCAKARAIVEIGICQNAELSRMDRELARIFSASKPDKFQTKADLFKDQKDWIKQRDNCVKSEVTPIAKSEVDCIRAYYKIRIVALAQSMVLSDFALAEEMLESYDTELLPYYRALNHYFTIKDKAKKSAFIKSDLKGEWGRMLESENVWVKGVLEDFGIKSLNDAIASDKKFGYLLSVLSSNEYGPIIIPCEAFRLKPGLMSALEPIFGSSRDNFLAQSDCKIPNQLPKLIEYTGAWAGEDNCDGTIRFAIYRSHQLHIEQILLGRFQELKASSQPYHDYRAGKSEKVPEFDAFLISHKALQIDAAKEIKAFWNKYYPKNTMTIDQIRDSLSALELMDITGC